MLDTLFDAIAHLEKSLSSIEKKFRQHLIIMLTSDFESTVVPKAVAKNELFFKVSVNIFIMVCRTVPIFLLKQRARLGGPSRYLEHVRKVCRKFSRDI